jgi:hypothetical protein
MSRGNLADSQCVTRRIPFGLAICVAAVVASGSPAATGGSFTRHQVSGLPLWVALPVAWQSVSVPASLTPAIVKRLVAIDPTAGMLANPALAHVGIRFLGNEPGRRGHFGANVNLLVVPLPHSLTLRNWFFSGSSSAMQYVGTTAKISNGGTPGLHYRSTKVQKYGTVQLLTDIYAFANDRRAFVFTYTSLASNARTYLPMFTTSGRSIRFNSR